MRGRSALFDSADVQDGVFEVDLLPAQVHQLGGPQTMPEGQQDHGGVAMAPAVVSGGLNQPLDLALGQVLAGPIGGVGPPHRQSNCAFYVGWSDRFQMPNRRHFPPLHAVTVHMTSLLYTVAGQNSIRFTRGALTHPRGEWLLGVPTLMSALPPKADIGT